MSSLERLGNRISVPLQPDEEGYIGRECPVESCLGYFKITPAPTSKGQLLAIAPIVVTAVIKIPFSHRSKSSTRNRSR